MLSWSALLKYLSTAHDSESNLELFVWVFIIILWMPTPEVKGGSRSRIVDHVPDQEYLITVD
jgi:hypothetical protein